MLLQLFPPWLPFAPLSNNVLFRLYHVSDSRKALYVYNTITQWYPLNWKNMLIMQSISALMNIQNNTSTHLTFEVPHFSNRECVLVYLPLPYLNY